MCFVRATPINILVWTLRQIQLDEYAARILDSYDQYLQRLDDEGLRTHLGNVPANDIYKDATFLELRDLSHDFQTALNSIFFEVKSDLRDFTISYGVF